MLLGWLNSFRLVSTHNIGNNVCSRILVQTRDYAARKGTRARREKNKIKKTIEKIGFVPPAQRKAEKVKVTVSPLTLIDESHKNPITDDVYVMNLHRQPTYSLKEAIEFHRETHHPTMLNEPDALVNAFIELNMKYEKRNKYIEKFSNIIDTPHLFKSEDTGYKVLALCKSTTQQEIAQNVGADFVGGSEIVKQIQAGRFEFKEFDYVVAHVDILSELLLIRGLLKRKFPNTRLGNLGNDMNKLVRKFKNAIKYSVIPDENHKDYGHIDIPFGKLNMDLTHLDENLAAVVNNVYSMGSKHQPSLIARVQIKSMPSLESFKVDVSGYLPETVTEEVVEEPDNTGVIESH